MRFDGIQALRGIACMMVAGYHLWVWESRFGASTPIFREIRWFGFAGVDLFFVISGFILTYSHAAEFGQSSAVPQFLYRRACRIYPPYLIAMLLSACMLQPLLGQPLIDASLADQWFHWFLLVPGGTPNPYAIPSQSLGYEMLFYAVLGASLCLPRKVAGALLIGWAIAVIVQIGSGGTDRVVLSPFVLEFLAGCGIAAFVRRGWTYFARLAIVLSIPWAIIAAAIVRANTTGEWGDVMTRTDVRTLTFGPPAMLVIYGIAALEVRKQLAVRPALVELGEASYALFLTHFPVQTLFVIIGMKLPHSRGPHLLWLGATMTAVMIVGFAFHWRIEKPIGRLLRRKKPVAEPVPQEEPVILPFKLAPPVVRRRAA